MKNEPISLHKSRACEFFYYGHFICKLKTFITKTCRILNYNAQNKQLFKKNPRNINHNVLDFFR